MGENEWKIVADFWVQMKFSCGGADLNNLIRGFVFIFFLDSVRSTVYDNVYVNEGN